MCNLFTSLQNLYPDAFCYHSRSVSSCHNTHFSSLQTVSYDFLDCHWLHISGFASVPIRSQINSNTRGLGLDCKMKWGEVHIYSFLQYSCTYQQCRTLHCLVVGWYFPSLDICHTVHVEASGTYKGNEQHWWFCHVAKTWAVCIL